MFRGRGVSPGDPLFLPADTAAALALAEEEADTCNKCGLPKAYCRDNENGRARFDVDEEWCWATYRVAQRAAKMEKEKSAPADTAARVHSAKFREGREPDIMAGLEP